MEHEGKQHLIGDQTTVSNENTGNQESLDPGVKESDIVTSHK